MIASVHAGSISKNASHAEFHWPAAFILSQTGVAAAFGFRFTPIAFASSSRIGAPRLHEWIDIEATHLQDQQDLVAAGAGFECAANMAAGPSGLKVRARSIHREAESTRRLCVAARRLIHGSPDILRHCIDPIARRVPCTKLRARARSVYGRRTDGYGALPHPRPEPGPRPVPQRQVCPAGLRCLSRIADGSLPFVVNRSWRKSHLLLSFSPFLSRLASSS